MLRFLRFRDPFERHGYDATRDEYFERLRRELEEALYTIVDLMPEKIREVLRSYYRCESTKDAEMWESTVRWQIVELAKPVSDDEQSFGSYLTDRAPCPLCGAESSSSYQGGFSLPEGLHRHLEGYGKVYKCRVMVAARQLSEAYFYEKFAEAEKRDLQEQLLAIQQRKKTEVRYIVEPHTDPSLIDELSYGDVAREPLHFAWAEQRLTELGFLTSTQNNVRQYVLDFSDFIVFADPRAKGKVSFRIYKTPIPKRKRSGKGPSYQSFSLQDNWTRNIQQQFQHMLSSAVDTLLLGAGAAVAQSYRGRIGGPTSSKTIMISPTFDARSDLQKAEDERQKEIAYHRAIGELMNRYDREKLYREVWSEPIQRVAKRYRLSDTGLAKICKRLLIPRPPRGYWAKKAAGVAVPPVPELPGIELQGDSFRT